MVAVRLVLPLLLALLLPDRSSAAEVKLLLPLGRTAYQTNEWIDVSVVRADGKALPAGTLTLTLTSTDAGAIRTTFTVPAVKVQGGLARAVEHLHVNGWLLRPGKYTIAADADGAKASTDIDVFSHVRQSNFKLINWGRAKGKEALVQGENSLGFNLFYGHYGTDEDAGFLRAGLDYMSNCVMSGGHQMDLRQECDWSDPLVTRGGTRRVVRRALIDRTRPNVPGVHFYDEPGLTWDKNDATGEVTPHMIRSQVQSYKAAFDREPLSYHQVDPKNPEHVERWKHWAIWKLGFMDAAWREAQFGVSQVRPDFLSVTQSQYGWSAFTDGYYFNVVRSLPVTSGHGGYHDYGPGFFNPSYFLEMARARDFAKPCWYLPTWYGNTTSDQFRLEQYLSFQTGLQGMMSPPDLEPAANPTGRQGIVESNHLMKKLGPIFTAMPVTRPPVAMLYSLSQCIHTQTQDRQRNYAHDTPQGKNLPLTYLAGKEIQQQFLVVVDEDIVDGTLANEHKAVVLTSIDHLAPEVVAALEDFAAKGGLVLLTGDSTVTIKGAVKLSVAPRMPDQDKIDELAKAKKYGEMGPFTTTAKYLEGALPLGKAIKAELDKKGIKPIFLCDNPHIIATRQSAGDIEYLFAVNAAPDADAKDAKGNPERITPKAAVATIKLPDDSRPIYDAVVGGRPREFRNGSAFLTGEVRFGPGQMRVFARTRKPIGGVRISRPVLTRDIVQEKEPLAVEFSVTLLDNANDVLSGSAPVQVRVLDALGGLRHELYRATKLGQLLVRLPLAANDPPGTWKVQVTELLNNSEAHASFEFTPPARVRSIAGATPRAVSFDNDRENIFRFARLHREVTIVKGSSPFNDAAAKRLAKTLEPWGVKCKEMPLADAAKSRKLTDDEARTWVGLAFAGKGQIKPGEGNAPALVGFAVHGPVILLGNPQDNPLLDFLAKEKFLPYAPHPQEFPGPGRGYISWQRDGVGAGQESVALIAYDEAGMSEAVGSCFEAVAGLEPLTRWTLPASDTLTPASKAAIAPAAKVLWTAVLPDRVLALRADGKGIAALTHDGSRVQLDADGKLIERKDAPAEDLAKARALPGIEAGAAELAKKQERPDRMLKLATATAEFAAIAYWGGTLRIVDRQGQVKSEQQLPQDATALLWQGTRLYAGLADGRVLALEAK